jgi:hypothetical protein
MQAALIRLVWQRAGHRGEYCWMPQEWDLTPFEIDHIIADKHKGPTVASNLCLSCFYCNSFKGSDVSSLDAETRKRWNARRSRPSKRAVMERTLANEEIRGIV